MSTIQTFTDSIMHWIGQILTSAGGLFIQSPLACSSLFCIYLNMLYTALFKYTPDCWPSSAKASHTIVRSPIFNIIAHTFIQLFMKHHWHYETGNSKKLSSGGFHSYFLWHELWHPARNKLLWVSEMGQLSFIFCDILHTYRLKTQFCNPRLQ